THRAPALVFSNRQIPVYRGGCIFLTSATPIQPPKPKMQPFATPCNPYQKFRLLPNQHQSHDTIGIATLVLFIFFKNSRRTRLLHKIYFYELKNSRFRDIL
ncbi:MAG: hypothetical protein J1E00_07505, partial [Oscillospiraceae bacterium]|nr:hypothetical protein [Oscillospiraceae bacterium]